MPSFRIKKIKWDLACFSVFIVIYPFYILPSGLPQIGDYLLMGIILYIFITKGRLNYKVRGVQLSIQFFGCFVLHTCIVNLIWSIALFDYSILIYSFFYVYNFLVCLLVLHLYRRYGNLLIRVLVIAVTTSILLQLILLPYSLSFRIRQILYFNNPNQLGYYCVVYSSIMLIVSHWYDKYKFFTFIVLVVSLFFSFLASSQASMGSCVFCLFLFLIRALKNIFRTFVFITFLVGLVVLGLSYLNTEEIWELIRGDVLLDKGTSIDAHDIETRAFSRITNYPWYNILGAGEGCFQRFGRKEIHSNYLTILFSYGLIGFSLFIGFTYSLIKKANFYLLLCLVPVAFYGVTHNGLRSTIFWLFFIVFLIIKRRFNEDKKFRRVWTSC